ncbi:MAG: metal-dependent hydrolase [Planctomycetota bacterium]|jgi:membrane-bound metal-dependent hydrolase YbcI (DUF457 family)
MSSILGHSLAGVIARQTLEAGLSSRKGRLLLCVAVFLAVLPDLDVLIYMIFEPSGMIPHRGVSHSLLFVLIAAGVFTVLTVRYFGISKTKLFSVYFLALFSHLALDFLMGAGPPIPLFAPFLAKGFLCPISLVPHAFYSTSSEGLVQLLLYPPAIVGFCFECAIFVPMILVLRKPRPRMVGVLLSISALGLVKTVFVYN